MAEDCQCIVCRHGRGEVPDEYFKGYLASSIKIGKEKEEKRNDFK